MRGHDRESLPRGYLITPRFHTERGGSGCAPGQLRWARRSAGRKEQSGARGRQNRRTAMAVLSFWRPRAPLSVPSVRRIAGRAWCPAHTRSAAFAVRPGVWMPRGGVPRGRPRALWARVVTPDGRGAPPVVSREVSLPVADPADSSTDHGRGVPRRSATRHPAGHASSRLPSRSAHRRHGGRGAVARRRCAGRRTWCTGAARRLAVTCGYCGTLMTPMAANFNIVPVAILNMKDRRGVIKNQVLVGLIMLVFQICYMIVLK